MTKKDKLEIVWCGVRLCGALMTLTGVIGEAIVKRKKS